MKIASEKGSAVAPLIVALVSFVAVVMIGYLVLVHVKSSTGAVSNITPAHKTTSSQQSVNAYAVLAPATVPPKVAECSQTLSYASNGDPSPVTCANGELNVLDWQAMAALEPTVMKLGYSPSEAQVKAAICTDGNVADQDSTAAISAPLEANAYNAAAIYYGWNFQINPITLLESGC